MATLCDICGSKAGSKKALKRHKELRHPKPVKPAKKRGKYSKHAVRPRPVLLGNEPELLPLVPPPPVVSNASVISALRQMAENLAMKAKSLAAMANDLERL